MPQENQEEPVEAPMFGYRVFLLDEQDHIALRKEFVATTDDAALSIARDILIAHPEHPACEVWQEKRQLCRLARDT
jgi:hypothetical protein